MGMSLFLTDGSSFQSVHMKISHLDAKLQKRNEYGILFVG